MRPSPERTALDRDDAGEEEEAPSASPPEWSYGHLAPNGHAPVRANTAHACLLPLSKEEERCFVGFLERETETEEAAPPSFRRCAGTTMVFLRGLLSYERCRCGETLPLSAFVSSSSSTLAMIARISSSRPAEPARFELISNVGNGTERPLNSGSQSSSSSRVVTVHHDMRWAIDWLLPTDRRGVGAFAWSGAATTGNTQYDQSFTSGCFYYFGACLFVPF